MDQARLVAGRAIRAGDFVTADRLSTLLLRNDPDDYQALMVRALVARRAGVPEDTVEFATRIYRESDDPALRFDAALLVANVKAEQEKFTTSQFWLRRADQVAPDDRRRAVAANAYRAVARRNPLSVQLRFGAKPSNNVNNGAETTVIEIGGLPFSLDPSGQQLSGYEASVGASLSFRLSESPEQRTDLLGEVFHRKIWLSDSAKTKAPDADGSDFDYSVLVTGVRHSRAIWPEIGPSRFTFLMGQSWYGGDELARWGELQFGQTVTQGETGALNFGLSARSEKRLDDDINSSRWLALSADVIRQFDETRVSWGGEVKNVWSDSATVDLSAVTLRGSWSPGTVGSIRPSLNGSVERRIFHKFSSVAGGRRDTTASLGLTVTWPDISYFGFVPQAALTARRTWSNVDIYDRNTYSLGLTAVSRF